MSVACSSGEYSDEEFEEYSDSFEADEERSEFGREESSSQRPLDSAGVDESEDVQWQLGQRVQVLWEGDGVWFDGVISQLESGRAGTEYLIQYDDGDAGWEPAETIRLAPTDVGAAEQLDSMLDMNGNLDGSVVHRRVSVYWIAEQSWFIGHIVQTDRTNGIFVEYDDGDQQWIDATQFRNVLVLSDGEDEHNHLHDQSSVDLSTASMSDAPAPPRILVPRQYKPVVTDHFQPVRVARPYQCVVDHHIGSILTARPHYSERAYLHCVQVISGTRTSTGGYSVCDCVVQTNVPGTSAS